MRKAIVTKYIPASNTLGARVSVKAEDCARRMVPWDHEFNVDGNHCAAAKAYAEQLGWRGVWVAGGGITGNVYVNVCDALDEEMLTLDRFRTSRCGVDYFIVH
jgi:hypothetical protein